jgi:hypothetical protein
MKKIITAAAVAILSLSFTANAYQAEFECAELTIDNIKSIYDARTDILIKNPYMDGVCAGITFSDDDKGKFNEYYKSIGVPDKFFTGVQGDFQRAVHAKTKSGSVFQKIIYVVDGERAEKVAGGFGERNAGRKKREEIMFYHEVSHLIKDSLDKMDVDSRELETMADISALYIYAHVNGLTQEQFEREVYHLFRDRQSSGERKGYGWYHKGIWLAFLNDDNNFKNVDMKSLSGVYDYIYGLRKLANDKPKDIVGILGSFF